jgi:hypothetical protein
MNKSSPPLLSDAPFSAVGIRSAGDFLPHGARRVRRVGTEVAREELELKPGGVSQGKNRLTTEIMVAIMRRARQMKFGMGLENTPVIELKPMMAHWHQYSKYRDIDFMEVWEFFKVALEVCRYPVKSDVVGAAMANLAPLPSFARNYPEDTQTLVRLCLTLAMDDPQMKFFLAQTEPQKRFGMDKSRARRVLNYLAEEGVWRVVTKGTRGPRGRATRYQWTAPVEVC